MCSVCRVLLVGPMLCVVCVGYRVYVVCVHWGTFIWKFCLGRTLVPDLVGKGVGGWGGGGDTGMRGILKIKI
jgi:hypothetical protein